jgi:Tol biopolymer transport system component
MKSATAGVVLNTNKLENWVNMKKIVLLLSALFLTGCAANQTLHGGKESAGIKPAVVASSVVTPAAPVEMAAAPLLNATNPNGGRSPAWSPDGSKIAFISSTLHTPADLWVMNADGSGARRLTSRGVQGFRWSADGESIMFVSRRKGFEEVMPIDLDGKQQKRIPGIPPDASLPLYSPDGQLFAFTAPGSQNVRDLWIGTADGARIEAVTDKISARSLIWNPDSRKIYYQAGKSYGEGIWEIDLATMESKALLNKYIGAPVFSLRAALFAFPYPTSPGEFDVHTMSPDGADIKQYKAPRLDGRWLAWDVAGKGVYYLGQELEKITAKEKAAETAKKEKQAATPHETASSPDFRKVGVTALWRLDLATGVEPRVSPAKMHLVDFDFYPGGDKAVVTGVVEKSPTAELFSLDMASGEMKQLAGSRASAWMPVPSHDASRIAFFTNEGTLDALKVASYTGEELAAYPDLVLEGDSRVYWLPVSDGLAVFSGRGLFAFTEKGAIEFPGKGDHRAYLYADASIQEDKVLINTIPRYGQTQGLYMLEAVDGKFAQTDLRYPSAPEVAAELYLQPRWSLDGKKIAFTDGIDVWTMNADGMARKWVTNYAQERKEGKGRDAGAAFPVWSVKGEMICYTLTVYEEKRVLRELWVMQADGTGPKMLFAEELDSQFQVFQPEYTNQPFFDATDERIIYTAADNGIPNIHAVEVKDGTVRRLTESGAIYPALLPEEGIIVYTSLEGNNERLWLMNSDGSEKRPFEFKAKPPPAPEAATATVAGKPVKKKKASKKIR